MRIPNKLPTLDASDKQFIIASLVVPVVLWWFFTGRKKYGVKGAN